MVQEFHSTDKTKIFYSFMQFWGGQGGWPRIYEKQLISNWTRRLVSISFLRGHPWKSARTIGSQSGPWWARASNWILTILKESPPTRTRRIWCTGYSIESIVLRNLRKRDLLSNLAISNCAILNFLVRSRQLVDFFFFFLTSRFVLGNRFTNLNF